MVLKKIVPTVNSNDSKIFSDLSIKILNDLLVGYKYPIGNLKKIEFSDAIKHKLVTIRLDAVNQFLAKTSEDTLTIDQYYIDNLLNSFKLSIQLNEFMNKTDDQFVSDNFVFIASTLRLVNNFSIYLINLPSIVTDLLFYSTRLSSLANNMLLFIYFIGICNHQFNFFHDIDHGANCRFSNLNLIRNSIEPNTDKKLFAFIIANDGSFNSLKIDLKTRLQNLNDGSFDRTSLRDDPVTTFANNYQDILLNGVNNFT